MRAAVALVAILAASGTAAAQPAVEFGGGLLVTMPRTLSTVGADLTRPDGSALELFRVEHRLGIGLAAEVLLGARLAPRLWAEISGSWGRPRLETRVIADFEGAGHVALESPLSLIEVAGAAVWHLAEGPVWTSFLRGGAGWTRELAGTSGLAQDGVTAAMGAGVKYWVRRSGGPPGRVGLRAEVRARLRSAGLVPGATGPSIAPAIHVGVLTRF